MKIVKQNAQYMSKENVTPYEFVEKVGRTCYKSEDSITDGSAEKFVGGLVKSQHWAMLEHHNIVIKVTHVMYYVLKDAFGVRRDKATSEDRNCISFLHTTADGTTGTYLVSGSFRAWRDLFYYLNADISFLLLGLFKEYPTVFRDVASSIYEDLDSDSTEFWDLGHFEIITEEDVKSMDIPDYQKMEHITHTFLFTTDRGVTHELVRHRPCSFAQESQRYCNYSKGKFGSEITVIEPFFFIGEDKMAQYGEWETSCRLSEKSYFNLINLGGCTPQEARTVLPNSVKADIIMTATESEWQHVVNLRYHGTTGAPHPQMVELMSMAVPVLVEKSGGRIK